ncbi:hypothetical protein HYQ44_013477 [Verticillium longisporum]|nr:hypothetical protein HYQ44_013477 [Verticillium longisporum]
MWKRGEGNSGSAEDEAVDHAARLARGLCLFDLAADAAAQQAEAVGEVGAAAGVLGVELNEVHADLDAGADVAGVDDVGADPLEDGLDGALVAALEGGADGAAVAQGEEEAAAAAALLPPCLFLAAAAEFEATEAGSRRRSSASA